MCEERKAYNKIKQKTINAGMARGIYDSKSRSSNASRISTELKRWMVKANL